MSRSKGNKVEDWVAKNIQKSGYKIIARNFLCKMGEIDIITQKNGVLIFIEVKYRKSASFGTASEMVTYHKQQKLIKTAQFFLMQNPQL